jgi:2-isopropylmalate synthase
MPFVDSIQKDPNRVIIFDTTLRDGEQSPGCSMTKEEKLRMARLLEELGVDVIEAGFPIASQGDWESVHEIAKQSKTSVICGLCRALPKDIEAAAEALKPAHANRIHTFISTSPLHMQYKLQMEPEKVLEKINDSVAFARKFTDDVEWSAEDGSRTEDDFLCRAVETAINAGATTINIPDTVGYSTPEDMARQFSMLKERVPNIEKAILSVHCHNDLGLAVANSMAGISAGARQAECTINGIGERAGNAALEEIIMTMRTRADQYGFENKIDTTKIYRISQALSSITGFNVQPNKAIVGANAFAHESGIHQDGMLKHAGTYEIMTPESVGIQKTNLVLGKHSGRHAFKSRLEELGYELGDNALNDAFARFKDLADRKKTIHDEDLIALVDADSLSLSAEKKWKLEELSVTSGTTGKNEARLTLSEGGQTHNVTAEGSGPIDALFKAISELTPHDNIELKLYQVHAVTGEMDAQAEVTVQLFDKTEGLERTVTGNSADIDTVVASGKAYIKALNKLYAMRDMKIEAQKVGP